MRGIEATADPVYGKSRQGLNLEESDIRVDGVQGNMLWGVYTVFANARSQPDR
jgi:hypothetical protein